MSACINCNNELSGKYCSNCGLPVKIKRIDGHYLMHEIEHVLHFEKGILFTIKELLTRPGQNVRNFIAVDRAKLVKPIIFVIITSLLYSVINHFFHIESGYVTYRGEKNSISLIFDWVQDHYGYANIIMGVFIAFWLKLFFRKYGYNFFEILILLCFVMGMGMLIISVFAVLEGLTKFTIMKASGVLLILYITWAIGQFFDKTKAVNYFKAFAAYVLGMVTFSLSAILVGFLIDLVIKH